MTRSPFEATAAAIYRGAAAVMARLLDSPLIDSILLHRSVATGEVSFGRSDIDLILVIGADAARDGEKLATLYRRLTRLRMVNPALNHIDVYEPGGIAHHAETDSFWASTERRASVRLRGKPVEFPVAAVVADHAVARFCLWVEWFFAIAVQQRNRRNLRKCALECWNAYATADGLLAEPLLRRSEMEKHLRSMEPAVLPVRLEEPDYATRFVFELARRLHGSRFDPLASLPKPLIFEAITAPLALDRLFVVLPRADHPLPAEAFAARAFPCTPEALHLYMHAKNAFARWVLPPQLLELGMKPPVAEEYLGHARAYCHDRFLRAPGFAVARHPAPEAVTICVRHALDWTTRGMPPPALSQEIMRGMRTGASSIPDYYRTVYPSLRLETLALQERLSALRGARVG